MTSPILKITDGRSTVNLINKTHGFHLSEWRPSMPATKGGGTFRSSPLNSGRSLVYKQLENWIDTYDLKMNAESQDSAIELMQNMRVLLDKATRYWIEPTNSNMVWIEAKAPNETNTRYAVIVDYRLDTEDNPYRQPFFNGCDPAMDDIILAVEHTAWQDTVPGTTGETFYVQEGRQSLDFSLQSNKYAVVASADDGYVIQTAGTFNNTGVNIQVGKNVNVLEAFVRIASFPYTKEDFDRYVKRAYLLLNLSSFNGNVPINLEISAEVSANATQITSFADFNSRSKTTAVAWDFITRDSTSTGYVITPDIHDLISARLSSVVGWVSGNALQFFILEDGSTSTGYLIFHSYNAANGLQPALILEMVDDYGDDDYLGIRSESDTPIYVSNFGIDQKLTHFFIAGGAAPIQINNHMFSTYPLTASPGISGDYLYFGSQDGNKFSALGLDVVGSGTATIVVERWYSGAWTAVTANQTMVNEFGSNANMFQTSGKKYIAISENLSAWDKTTINGVNTYWVRIQRTAGTLTLNSRPFIVNHNHFDVLTDDIRGEISALLHAHIKPTYELITAPTLPHNYPGNTTICSRSLSRGKDFITSLHFTDTGNPNWMTASAIAPFSFANNVSTPSGRALLFNPAATGSEASYDNTNILVGKANQYAGKFVAYLRVQQISGVDQEFRVRLRVESGVSTMVYTGDWKTIKNSITSYEHIYLGAFDVQHYDPQYTIYYIIDTYSTAATPGDLHLFDIVLLPADELYINIDHGEITFETLLVDSVEKTKSTLETYIFGYDGVYPNYFANSIHAATPFQIKAKEMQRVFFFTKAADYYATTGSYYQSRIDGAFSLLIKNLQKASRYYSARGGK